MTEKNQLAWQASSGENNEMNAKRNMFFVTEELLIVVEQLNSQNKRSGRPATYVHHRYSIAIRRRRPSSPLSSL